MKSYAFPIIARNFDIIPSLRIIDEEISQLFVGSISDITDQFLGIARPGILSTLVKREVQLMSKGDISVNDGSENEVFLFGNNEFAISLLSLKLENPRNINNVAGIAVDIFLLNPSHKPIVIPVLEEYRSESGQKVRTNDSITLLSGDIKKIGYQDQLIPDIAMAKSGVILTLRSAYKKSDLWVYDRPSGDGLYRAAVKPNDSRCVLACKILGESPVAGTTDTLAKVAQDHSAHFVRWEALKALGRIDPKRAIESLKVASVSDLHPHVRNAAKKTLLNINGS